MVRHSAWSFAFLASLAAAAAQADPPPAEAAPPEVRYPHFFGEHWFGLYLLGSKIGHLQLVAARETDSREYVATMEMVVVDASSGEAVEQRMSMVRRYAGQPPYPLIGGHDRSRAQGSDETLRLHREPDGSFRIETESGGKRNELRGIETKEVFSTGFVAGEIEEVQVGYQEEMWTLDLEKARDQLQRVTLQKRESRVVNGVAVETLTFKLEEPDSGIAGTFVCDRRGMPFKMQFLGVIEARLESADVARDPGRPVNLVTEMLVPLRGLEAKEEDLRGMTLEWRGADALLPRTATQSAAWRTEGRVQTVVLTRALPPEAAELAAPVPDEIRRYLAADATVTSDHPDVRARARELTRGAPDRWAAVGAICGWVDTAVDDRLNANSTTALGVLQRRAGDCSEHTLLAVALLRAAGVPAREVSGVIHVADVAAMGWHAWVEVWVGRWIPVDPTWGQVPAGLGRVAFMVEGDPTAQLSATGRMRARVVVVERRP